ncbi:hypothetical protein F4778DRAFT_783176 [Xylariomycetidae sp. FL2044]|nr:hypothetical protein F4778DRAFT_783176 [Xylariomycetidae sp. FL2044]
MQLSTSVIVALFAGLSAAALPKANEYKSDDCSGDINYHHHGDSDDNQVVGMDDTTHSVYLAGQDSTKGWFGYSGGKTQSSGNYCTGEKLGQMHGKCNNLDTSFGSRVKCVALDYGLVVLPPVKE